MKTSTTKRGFFTAMAFVTAIAGSFTTFEASAQSQNNDYTFRRNEQPKTIRPYYSTVYTSGDTEVTTMRGDILHKGNKKTITDFEISPAGNIIFTIDRNKKGKIEGNVYNTSTAETREFKFDIKKYGTPSAVTFTPDARQIIVATDKGIFMFDTKKYRPTGRIDLVPIVADRLVMSPNGYYLVLINGKDIVVYNFEDKKIRKRIDAEVPVNDVVFSSQPNTMAVLSSDGLLSIYDTRTFETRTMLDDLGEGLACAFNDNGKYIAVATAPDKIEVINLLRTNDRKEVEVTDSPVADLDFISDSMNNPLLVYTQSKSLAAKRMLDLEPNYSRLVSEGAALRMNEWLKMQPGETMAEYEARVNDESQRRQRTLFEDEISTQLAGDMLSMSDISLGQYDRQNQVLNVGFSNLPSIWLPVPEGDVTAFTDGKALEVSDAQYGVLPDDSFELIYAKFLNKNDGKTYVYDNKDRKPMDLMGGDTDFVSLDILRQQQMEEIRLQEVKEQVMAQAKKDNIISDHTNITVDSRVVPDYDADGNKILNYIVKFTYQVEPEFSAVEDFAPGKYVAGESGAASSMLKIVKQAFEGDFAQYLKEGKRLNVSISGTADATPIVHGIPYNGIYGDFENEPVSIDGNLSTITVTEKSGIKTNEQLAFLRGAGVEDFLKKNIKALSDMDTRYNYNVAVSEGKGSEFRRITAEFMFVDAF